MMVRVGYVAVIIIMLALVLVTPVGAQDVIPAQDAADVVLAMSVGELVSFVMALVGLAAGVVAVVVAWVRTAPAQRTVAGLDTALADKINAAAGNPALVTPLEDVYAKLAESQRQAVREVAEVVLRAAMWTPAKTDDAVANLFTEITDGDALAAKLGEMDAALKAYQQAVYPTATGDLGAVPKADVTGGGG